MCGIAVIIGERNKGRMKKMMLKMKHRGPDEKGTFFKGDVSFGHLRLSIIDLNTGTQPIFNETGDKCIMLNGEIYNFRNLYDELKDKHTFSTKTDTEVIIHLYEEYGESCIDYLEGMFCFAIYDNGKVFIARDRIGIKPLYFGYLNGRMHFASEIKALKGCDNIEIFPPGNTYSSIEGFKQYYSLPKLNKSDECHDEDELTKKIKQELTAAVEKRMVSDVPVGVFLSGGLDSSIIAYIMKEYNPDLHTFSAGFKNSPDLIAARKVADYLGTKHYEYVYDLDDMLGVITDVIYYLESFDAPLVRSSIPGYMVAKLASKYVKVILTGEGADELFSGYHYLKDFDVEHINAELLRITANLHNSNLQRTDRMTMAHSIEGRVPFLDPNFVKLAFNIPPMQKIPDENNIGKVLLRKAFEGCLPEEILWRTKAKFSEGAGSSDSIKEYIEDKITENEFFMERANSSVDIRSKEELFYYRIYRSYYDYVDDVKVLGRTRDFN